jgi:hypothetical protein
VTTQTDIPEWHQLKNDLLRERSLRLVGPQTSRDDVPPIVFTVTHQSDGEITVELNDACDLPCVYALCDLVSTACLEDDDHVVFVRAPSVHADDQDAV